VLPVRAGVSAMQEWPSTLDVSSLIADGWHPTPFREFILKVHSRCDLSCRYCYMYEMADQSWRSRPKRMSRQTVNDTCARIAKHVRANSLTSIQLVLHGGEPLLAGSELIRYIVTSARAAVPATCDVKVSLQTNGVLLSAAYLKLFDELDIHVGVSLDGDADAHNRHRRRANGEGSHAAVIRGLEELTSAPFRHLFNGLLCTIDPRNSPVATYEALARFGPPVIDFLLPHGNWLAPPPGRLPRSSETPYGDWLAAVFDRWYSEPVERTTVRMFSEIMKMLMGAASTVETLGLSPVGIIVIETDGSIDQGDSLKSAYQGAPDTGLHVSRDSFDAALRHPSVVARQIGERALSATCCSCRLRRVCGGGLYAHRFHPESGFKNPSVYCPDLQRIITHILAAVKADVTRLKGSHD
jgi:uncharacterized protein